MTPRISLPIFILLLATHQISTNEDGYLRYVKDGCFIRGEALSCVKYKALKIAKKTIFGDDFYANKTIKANSVISLVPLDEETIQELKIREDKNVLVEEPRSIFSEWTQLAQYLMKLVQDFFRMKGVRVELPEGARSIEESDEDASPRPASPALVVTVKAPPYKSRARKKKLALIIPLLTLVATIKTKLLLIPILLAVFLIKKLLLIAALLLPSLLSTLKHCKHRGGHVSYFGGSDTSDFSSDYNNYYSTGYSKDWALNRAYSMPKHRPTPNPMYITAPGAAA